MPRLFWVLWMMLGATAVLLPQADTGVVSGTVKDSSGAVMPAVSISIQNTDTGQGMTVVTNNQGLYVSPPLRPGNYVIGAEATGFRKALRPLPLEVNQRAVVDFDMVVGAVAEEATVMAVAPLLQTESATLSNMRNERAVKDLPLNGRNYTQLIQLSAGAVPIYTQISGTQIVQKRGVPSVSINGARHEDNNILIEGMNNIDNHGGNGILFYPSIDAILEFRVESSVADAEFGRGGGGTVNLVYKSGAKDFHGGLYEFFRNSKLDAKNFFDSPTAKIPPYKQNQFGAFLGGPVMPWKSDPKTFFFANYEGGIVRQAQTFVSSVPLAAHHTGDFSTVAQRLFDPLTQRPSGTTFVRDPFPGNQIPADRLDPVGKNLIDLYPLPNLPGVAANYLANPSRTSDTHKHDLKIDHTLSSADSFFARWSRTTDDVLEPGAFPTPAVGAGGAVVPGHSQQTANQVVVSETHILSPNKTNEFRVGWTRLAVHHLNLNYGNYVSEQVGIPGSNVPGDILTSGFATFTIAGLQNMGENAFSPAIIVSDNIQAENNFNYIRGAQTFKFGGGFQRRRYNAFQSPAVRGSMSFTGVYTQNPAAAAGTGLGTADVLLGKPVSGNLQTVNGTRGFRRTELFFYGQNVWKVSARLTLTLGLRYDNILGWPWTEVADRIYQILPSTGAVVRVGTGNVPWRSGVPNDGNNFSSRLGLAAKITSWMVFRAGYGVFYSAPPLDVTSNLALNPPEGISSGYTNNQFDFVNARPASRGFDRPAQGVLAGVFTGLGLDARMPYTQQWNASFQFLLPGQISVTSAYVGSKGTKLQGRSDVNLPLPGDGNVDARRPLPQFQAVRLLETKYNSSYQAAQLTAERRFGTSLGFQLAYAWSHAIDVLSSETGILSLDPRNVNLDRGNALWDLRHRLSASWSYQLPFRSRGPLNHLVGGWQVNGILSLYTGFFFTVTSSVNTLNTGGGNRPDALRNAQLPHNEQTLQRWFDTSAFVPPGFRQFGTSGRDTLSGPGTRQLDASLFKQFFFSESHQRRLEFRAEFFNLSNTPQFNNPAATFGAQGFGIVSSAGSPVTLQRIPRQIQFGLKFYF